MFSPVLRSILQQRVQRGVWLVVSSLHLVVPAPAARATPAPIPTPFGDAEEEPRLQVAREHYQQDRYLDAAAAFEALWADYQRPRYLYFAGLAHEGAGHDAQAILAWQRALADGLEEPEAGKARSRVGKALARTAALDLQFLPGAVAARVRIELTRAGLPTPIDLAWTAIEESSPGTRTIHLEPGEWQLRAIPDFPGFDTAQRAISLGRDHKLIKLVIELPTQITWLDVRARPFAARRARIRLTLRDPEHLHPEHALTIHRRHNERQFVRGRWTYTAEARGFMPLVGEIFLEESPARLVLEFERPPLSPEARRDRTLRITLGASLSLAGLATGITGAVLLKHTWNLAPADAVQGPGPTSNPCIAVDIMAPTSRPACHAEAEARKHINTMAPASMLLGASLGLWTTAAIGATKPRRLPFLIAAGTGSALLVGGLVGAVSLRQAVLRPEFRDSDEYIAHSDWNRYRAQVLGTGLLTGLGAGMLVGAGTGLLLERKLTASPTFQRAGLGLSLTGRF